MSTTHVHYVTDLTQPFYITSPSTSPASLLVIDHITVSVDPGADTQVITVTVSGGGGATPFWSAFKLFDANAPDTIDVDFQNGLPAYNETSGSAVHGKISTNTQIAVTFGAGVGALGSTASITYHHENPALRRS